MRSEKYEKLKMYQDPKEELGSSFVFYQDNCHFYPKDFEVRDQCLAACDHVLEQMELRLRSDDELLGIFIQAGLVLSKLGKVRREAVEKYQNECRMQDWIYKKLMIKGKGGHV